MKTKLTLRIDDQLIAKAKQAAQSHGISVSDMVSRWFSALPESSPPGLQEISPQLRSLIGIAKSSSSLTDEQLREEYTQFLADKHS